MGYFDNGALAVIVLLAGLEAADEGAAHFVGHMSRYLEEQSRPFAVQFDVDKAKLRLQIREDRTQWHTRLNRRGNRHRGRSILDQLVVNLLVLQLQQQDERQCVQSGSVDGFVVDLIHQTQFDFVEPGQDEGRSPTRRLNTHRDQDVFGVLERLR